MAGLHLMTAASLVESREQLGGVDYQTLMTVYIHAVGNSIIHYSYTPSIIGIVCNFTYPILERYIYSIILYSDAACR